MQFIKIQIYELPEWRKSVFCITSSTLPRVRLLKDNCFLLPGQIVNISGRFNMVFRVERVSKSV